MPLTLPGLCPLTLAADVFGFACDPTEKRVDLLSLHTVVLLMDPNITDYLGSRNGDQTN